MIIVAGMHRSGTSLTAQMLQSLGADFGAADQMWEADQWNANGYLERRDVIDYNSRLITGVTRTDNRFTAVASQASYLRMPKQPTIAARAAKESAGLSAVGEQVQNLAVKDPRFCLTLPYWLATQDVEAVVVALRHPSASVASLARRNRLPKAVGYRFWTWHMAALLRSAPDDAVVVRQDELVGSEPQQAIDRLAVVARLADNRPRSKPNQQETASELAMPLSASELAISQLDPSLVHHEPDDRGVPAATLDVWEQWLSRC